jgi:hypothetical protein
MVDSAGLWVSLGVFSRWPQVLYIVYTINKKRTLVSLIKQRTPAFRDQAVNLQTLPKSYATRQQRIVSRGEGDGGKKGGAR